MRLQRGKTTEERLQKVERLYLCAPYLKRIRGFSYIHGEGTIDTLKLMHDTLPVFCQLGKGFSKALACLAT